MQINQFEADKKASNWEMPLELHKLRLAQFLPKKGVFEDYKLTQESIDNINLMLEAFKTSHSHNLDQYEFLEVRALEYDLYRKAKIIHDVNIPLDMGHFAGLHNTRVFNITIKMSQQEWLKKNLVGNGITHSFPPNNYSLSFGINTPLELKKA